MEQKLDIESLFKEYYIALHRYAFTILRQEDEAKDVVQEVFMTLWEKNDTISINRSARSYLFRSVYNECLNHIRKREVRQRHHHLSVAQQTESESSGFPEEEEETLLQKKMNTILQSLPNQCRKVFMKSRAEQKKYVQIAEEMGIAVKTVETHMSKALKLIRQAVRVLLLLISLYTDII